MHIYPGLTFGIIREADRCRIRFHGLAAKGPRTMSALRMATALAGHPDSLAHVAAAGCAHGYVFQHGDYAHHPVFSVAYGRIPADRGVVELVPDAYFVDSRGYAAFRRTIEDDGLHRWENKDARLVWRGSSTFDPRREFGTATPQLGKIPRVRLCLALSGLPHTDVGISQIWGARYFPDGALATYLRDAEVLADPVRPADMARARLLVDIDGVGNAWGLFEKLLMGSCILKVGSPFEQWYYDRLRPWVHYVPVARDLSDLHERVDWCLAHDADAREIGESARALALSMTMETENAAAVAAMNRVSFRLP